ncbi:MAG: transcription antitermination factor NusB [Candidatus Gracilibacteria bacterium]|nr:transcription antitermination factor NusB [Candidatus Gracilibacteria bacterium]
MVSRRRTREYLLQALYARAELGSSYDRATFTESFFQGDTPDSFEYSYVDMLEGVILPHEAELLSIISHLAPKFDLATMPVLHILILMIALSEILYAQNLGIPESVSVNEAIELAKRFSDDHGKGFINGALSTFLKEREKILAEKKNVKFRVFK